MTPFDLVGMVALGALGSLHCLAMCSAFAVCLAARRSSNTLWYHLGRWISYVVLGGAMGAVGTAVRTQWDTGGGRIFIIVAGGLMVLMGLALAGWIPHLALAGAPLGRWLRPLLTTASPTSAFSIGTLTGLLPCGLLYAALARAAASGHVWSGAILMAAFWMGTTPVLVVGSQVLPRFGRTRGWPRLAGGLVVLLGVVTLLRAWPGPTRSVPCPMCAIGTAAGFENPPRALR